MSPNVSALLLVVLTCLATHRVTRLLTRDHLPIIAIPREKITLWLDPPMLQVDEYGIKTKIEPTPKYPLGIVGRSIAFLLECDWCMSVWMGGGIIAAEVWGFHLNVPYPFLLWATASTVAGLIATHEPD